MRAKRERESDDFSKKKLNLLDFDFLSQQQNKKPPPTSLAPHTVLKGIEEAKAKGLKIGAVEVRVKRKRRRKRSFDLYPLSHSLF